MYEQPILFEKNSYNFCQHIDENIFDEHLRFFTQSLIEEKKDYGDYRDLPKEGEKYA